MRHGKKINHLSRTSSHRKALLSNMATSLIMNKRITTTVAKAKALRKYVEPIINRTKTDTTHSRREIFALLQNKEPLKELFGTIADKVATRPGGYTRIIRLAPRQGDAAEMCIMELVDFNEIFMDKANATVTKTRRSRRSTKSVSTPDAKSDQNDVETTAILVNDEKESE